MHSIHIMFLKIEEFCDDNRSPLSLHNPLAPNRHNQLCGENSAWMVMKEKTTDFVHGPQVVTNTTPTFDVVQVPPVRSVVLVLDISGSMSVRIKTPCHTEPGGYIGPVKGPSYRVRFWQLSGFLFWHAEWITNSFVTISSPIIVVTQSRALMIWGKITSWRLISEKS